MSYSRYVARFAEIYIQEGKAAGAAAEEIRKRFRQFPRFSGDLFRSWLKRNTHGFRDEARLAERRSVAHAAALTREWLMEELEELARRKEKLVARENALLRRKRARRGPNGAEGEPREDVVPLSRAITEITARMDTLHEHLVRLDSVEKETDADRYRAILYECLNIRDKKGDSETDDERDE